MIEDLDAIVEPGPGWCERWLLPLAAGVLVVAVLASSFARQAPLRSSFFPAPAPRVSVLAGVSRAAGPRSLELPRNVATGESRTHNSGVTGLTSMGLSDGFRDRYRFPDGRVLIVIEYPDPANATPIAPASGPTHAVTLRGVSGLVYPMTSTSTPLAVGWVADGMQYTVGGAGFSAEELIRFAEALH